MTSGTISKSETLEYTNVQRRKETGNKKKALFHREMKQYVQDLEKELNEGNSR